MATSETPWFRELYDEILQYERQSLFDDILKPWIKKAEAAMVDLARFKVFSRDRSQSDAERFSMWNLYALGRVNDLLLMSFQGTENQQTPVPQLQLQEYSDFFFHLGFELVQPHVYSPFHHEIVRVRQMDPNEFPTEIVGHLWPGLKLGQMLFSRGGVEIACGTNDVVKGIADLSTLYFTYRRLNRPTNDQSMGWGGNSQWRTRFRRDYELNRKLIYNADGPKLLNSERREATLDGLTVDERIELCRHRCFVRTAKPHDDLFPFDDRYEEAPASVDVR